MTEIDIPPEHPRADSLRTREKLTEQLRNGVVAIAGLIAHGRGEAFDYLLGEKTNESALNAIEAAVSSLLLAKKPVISVNGNVAALTPDGIVKLSRILKAKIEVNLFYRSHKRELAIKRLLEKAGAQEVLGIGEEASSRIPELGSERRRVDPKGILVADVVLVLLEDGDRTEALVQMGKEVIAIDLNPLSRTAQKATITIVDNIVRAIPKLIEIAQKMKHEKDRCHKVLRNFDNSENLAESLRLIGENLARFSNKRQYISLGRRSRT